jgi:hypothetical protein
VASGAAQPVIACTRNQTRNPAVATLGDDNHRSISSEQVDCQENAVDPTVGQDPGEAGSAGRSRALTVLLEVVVAAIIGAVAVLAGLWFGWLPLCAKAVGLTLVGVVVVVAALLELANTIRRTETT